MENRNENLIYLSPRCCGYMQTEITKLEIENEQLKKENKKLKLRYNSTLETHFQLQQFLKNEGYFFNQKKCKWEKEEK